MDIKGCNYYIFPSPAKGKKYSARFDPESPFFQSFFGIYVVPPLEDGPVPLDVVPILGERDNTSWIHFMGAKHLSSSVLSNTSTCIEKNEGRCVKWKLVTRYSMPLDVGPDNPEGGGDDPSPAFADLPDLWRVPRELWKDHVNGYQEAIQDPVIQYVWYENDILFVNFLISYCYRDRNGNYIDGWNSHPVLQNSLNHMANTLKIINRKEKFGCEKYVPK